ncbi:hypothetical protein [Mycobacteroides abscessus]|uniref:hypothetical protein n=1 Tax=Mycobacteroides abscessus TaxID=36809 RepID=UPI00089DC5B9|nr:hypothetical protein BST18_11705 [Mycobacteroides abscessus subsp. bolletii]TPF65885.1 hypothetical protein XW60_23080 [Mycobacteroides abscessus subsp. bolletii]BBB42645.1 hypothetical protein MASB_32110 [Mycobacteroides abscessus subsp. bolletii BD]
MTTRPVYATEVASSDCFLYAHVCDGRLYVNRSVLVRDTDPIFQLVRDIIGDAEPVEREMVADPNMMLCRAIREIYDVQ